MTARQLVIATALVLATSVALRAGDLVELWQPETLRIELSRWDDPEFSAAIEEGVGHWLAQNAQEGLKIDLVDRSSHVGRAEIALAGRRGRLFHAPTIEQLRPVFAELARRLRRPERLVIVATELTRDRSLVANIRELATEMGWTNVVVVSAETAEQPSPTVPSARGDWVLVATEAAREHLRTLLRVPGRKIFFLAPYPEALKASHPELWFVAPWNPALEYFPGRKISSCQAFTRMRRPAEHWPLSGLPLSTMSALDVLTTDSGPAAPLPLTLVGPPARGRGPPVQVRSGPRLPPCPRRPQ